MNEEKTVEVTEGYLNSLQLSRMRADICKMAMEIKDQKSIEFAYFFMNHKYIKELIDEPCTIKEMAEDIPNHLLFTILSLFKAEQEDWIIKKQVIKYFEEEIESRERLGILSEYH